MALEEVAGSRRRRGSTPPGSRRARAAASPAAAASARVSALRLVAEREPEPVERRRVDAGEHVALVLPRVGRAGEQQPPVALDDPRVVAGREPRGADAVANASSSSKRKLPLQRTHGFGVSPRAYPSHERRRRPRCAELLAQVERDVRDARARGRLARAAITARRRAARPLGVGPFGSSQSRSVTPTASGPALSSATALSTPPLIATATRPRRARRDDRPDRVRERVGGERLAAEQPPPRAASARQDRARARARRLARSARRRPRAAPRPTPHPALRRRRARSCIAQYPAVNECPTPPAHRVRVNLASQVGAARATGTTAVDPTRAPFHVALVLHGCAASRTRSGTHGGL